MSLNRDSQGRQSMTFLTCINLDDFLPPTEPNFVRGKQNYSFIAQDFSCQYGNIQDVLNCTSRFEWTVLSVVLMEMGMVVAAVKRPPLYVRKHASQTHVPVVPPLFVNSAEKGRN
jgi:hypothetical protein